MTLPIPPYGTIPGDELSFSAARSGGPGGQNVNKVNSKVVLRFDLEASGAFTPGQKERLRARLPPRYLTAKGELVIASDTHRDQPQNRQACLDKLEAVVRQALHRPKRRIATKPSRGARERRLQSKAKQSQKKRMRSQRDFS